jgi:hypothetical protein
MVISPHNPFKMQEKAMNIDWIRVSGIKRFTLGFYISGSASHQSRQDTITNVLPTAIEEGRAASKSSH